MKQVNNPPFGGELPGEWGKIYDRLCSDRDRLDDTYVTEGNFRFRIGQQQELEQKHGVNLGLHRLEPVMGVPAGTDRRGQRRNGQRRDPRDRESAPVSYGQPSPKSETGGTPRVSAFGDLVPYLSVGGDRDVFLDRESWVELVKSLGPSQATFATMLDDPDLLEKFVNHQISHKWRGETRLLRMRRLDGGRRRAMRVRAILPDDYVRLDSVYLVPAIYRALRELRGPRLDVDGISPQLTPELTPDAMLLTVRASESVSMKRLNERFANGMHIYNSEVDDIPPLDIEIIMVRLVCLNGMTVTERDKFVSVQRHVRLGREAYSGLPPAELPQELQREIDDLVHEALYLSWVGADRMTSRMTRDVEQQAERLANTQVPLETREAVHRAVSELALQTAMRFVPEVEIDRIVEAYNKEVEEERKRMAKAPGREVVVAGTAWGLYNAFTRYATHTAGKRRLSTARSLHRLGRKFLSRRINWERVRARANPPNGRRRKIYLPPPSALGGRVD